MEDDPYESLGILRTSSFGTGAASAPRSRCNSGALWAAIVLVGIGVVVALTLVLKPSSSSNSGAATEETIGYIRTVLVSPNAGSILVYTAANNVDGAVDISMNVTIPNNFTSGAPVNFTLHVVPGADLYNFAVNDLLNQSSPFAFELTSSKGAGYVFQQPLVLTFATQGVWDTDPVLRLLNSTSGLWSDAALTCPNPFNVYNATTHLLTVHVCH